MWGSVAEAASSFMANQRSQYHFDFFGIDVIPDTTGQCWLIEANRLPGLEIANGNQRAEATMSEMLTSLLSAALQSEETGKMVPGRDWTNVTDGAHFVREVTSDKTAFNLLNWKAFTKKNRSQIFADLSSPDNDLYT